MRTAAARRAAERAGRLAEAVAVAWLLVKGFSVVDRRVRNGHGEIDLIVRRGRLIAFVEVKRRPTAQAGFDALRPKGRRRIARAAEAWRAPRAWARDVDARFDLVIIRPWRRPIHVADAWRPDA